MLVGVARFFFLQMARVRQKNAAQIARGRRAVDAACITIFHQHGQIAAVIDVRMGEHDGINALGRDRRFLPVFQPQLFQALEQPAVNQHLF